MCFTHATKLSPQPIIRKQRKFSPLNIPKALQAALPFASKVRKKHHELFKKVIDKSLTTKPFDHGFSNLKNSQNCSL